MLITDYSNAFQRLRTAKGAAKYPATTLHHAPHKPILLLSVLDLAARAELSTNFIPLTIDLGTLFTGYWKLVMPMDRHGNLYLPFFHLKSDGFWHLVPQQGKEHALAAIRQIASMSQLRETIVGAQLDAKLHALICVSETRELLRSALIEKYFHSDFHEVMRQQAVVNLQVFQYSESLLQQPRIGSAVFTAQPDDKPQVRDQGFRRAIVTAYNHRCVLCGLRLVTAEGQTIANAAHIIPWTVSHNDDPRNGLCLCGTCHTVFDLGLAGITDRYRVTLSRQLSINGNIAGHLSTLENRPIFEPTDAIYKPDLDALEWHLHEKFKK